MSKWIHFQENWFNLDDFCHIWIEKGYLDIQKRLVIYYLMGEFRHNSEEVILSGNYLKITEIVDFMNHKLGIVCTKKMT